MLPSGFRLGFALVLAISLTQQPQSALGAAPPAAPEVPATVQPPPPETREDTPLPTAEEIATRLKAIQEDPTIAAELKAQLVEVITDLAKQLPEINQHQQRRETLAAGAAAAPEELAKAQRLKEAPPGSARPPLPPLRTLAEVRAKKEEINSQLESNIQQQQAIEAELRKRDERRKSLPQLLVDTRTRLQKLESEPPPAPDSVVDPRLQQARQDLRRARLKAARAELASLQQESKTYEAEADLLPLRRELLVREVQQLKEVIQQLTKYLSNQRNFDIESICQRLQALAQSSTQREAEEVRKSLELLQQWTDVVRDSVKIEGLLTTAKSEAASVAKELEDVRKKTAPDLQNGNGLSSWMGLYLQRKREQLPNVSELRRELMSQQEQLEKTEALLANVSSRLEELREPSLADPISPNALVMTQREALEKMKSDLDKNVWTFFSLSAERERMINDVIAFQTLVDEHVLWMRSAAPIQASDLPDAWRAFQIMVHPQYLSELKTTAFQQLYRRIDLAVIWIVGSGALFVMAGRLRKRLSILGEQAAKKNATRMGPTWLALAITATVCLPVVFALAIPGWRLRESIGSVGYVHAVGYGLLAGAWFLLPLEFLRQMARPNGIGVSHFNWPNEIAAPLRANMRWIIDLGLPLVIAWVTTEQQRDSRDNVVSLNRFLFIGLMSIVAIILWRVLHPKYGVLAPYLLQRRGGWLDRLRYVWHPAIAGLPVLFAGFSLAGYGYLAGRLAVRLFDTVWVITGLVMLGGLLTRWVLLSRRRMILAQIQQRAEQSKRDENRDQISGAIEIPESPPLDVSQISQQTLRLIRAFLMVGSFLGMAWVWSSVLPALNILDQIELWRTTASDGRVESVTLTNLLLTIPLAVMTVVAVRNLPGLLETVVLQHLPLESAARYAITTLSSYTLAFIGILCSASVLGLHWNSIQWLVAALGVGLGFGLQEIFANFISGIILLFEQPIRVGDVITIDGVTGVVSRIRIRATTVTNWDRQELIIPNKDLITGRLLNWTLSDSTNRIVINVGVAYGTDTRFACHLLEKICKSHSNIASDPAPVIAFEEFANSTLKLTIRAFLNSLDVRLPTIHDLHTQIHEEFQREGISIAFPQQDIHIRSMPPGWQMHRDGDLKKAS